MILSSSIKLTNIFFKILTKALKIKVELIGEDNIPKNKSILFCANHFTRLETLLLPYYISKIEHVKYTRSLAYKDLFFGKVGDYLRNVKAISTGDKNRDKIIINDLSHNYYNWIIYPEGFMKKDKKIFTTKPSIIKKYKALKFSARTGVSTLAIKAEFQSIEKGKLYICPITISYRPIYAKKNTLYLLLRRFLEKPNMHKKLKHEMFFESSVLSFSKMIIQFHKPISIKDYISNANLIPKFWKIEYLRYSLTNDIMHIIYKNTPLTFDHFASLCFFSLAEGNILKVKITMLKELIFNFIATALITRQDLNYSESINEFFSLKLLLKNEKHEMFENIIKEMEIKNFAYVEDDVFYLKKENLLQDVEFIEIRIKNIFKVFFNEISYFKTLCKIIKQAIFFDEKKLIKQNGMLIFDLLERNYLNERQDYSSTLKPEEIGKPSLKLIGDNGVLLCHGFKSSPREMEKIELFLNDNGFSTYSLRLKGHGTSPENLKKYGCEDWVLSHHFSSEAMFRVCTKVFICGFSMGGLLSLINATKFNYAALITISAPLAISNYKFYFAGILNELTIFAKLINKNVQDFVTLNPEHADINYKKTYFKSLKDLNLVIKKTKSLLKLVSLPVLIIYGKNDKIISINSVDEIFNNISSKTKEIFEYENKSPHVIVLEENNTRLLNKILTFIKKF